MTWTEEMDERAKVLRRAGASFGRIADLLGQGLSRNAVIGRMRRLGFEEGNKRVGLRSHTPKRPPSAFNNSTAIHHNIAARKRAVAPPKFKTEPLPKARADAPPSKRLSIGELTAHLCRYIADESPPYTYCGETVVPGYSWCEFHKNLCLQKVSVSEANRRASREARAA